MKYSFIILWTSSWFLVTNAVPLPKSSEDGSAVQDDSNEDGLIGESEESELLSNEDSEESIAEESLNADNSGENIDERLDINKEDEDLDENDYNENLEEDRTNENNGDAKVEDTPKENIVESTANNDNSVGGESETAVNIDEPADDDEVVKNGSQDSKEESTLLEDEALKDSHADDDLVGDNNPAGNTEDNYNDDGDDKHKSDIKTESDGELESDDKLESDDELENDDDKSNAGLMISVEDQESYLSVEDDDDGEYVTEIVEFTEIVGGDIVEGNSGEANVIKEGNIAYDHIGGDNFAYGKNEISYGASSADIDTDKKSKLVGTEVIIEETKLDDSNGNSKRKNEMNTKAGHYSATPNSNEDSSEHKDEINAKSGHHRTSSYRNEDSSERKDKINTKSGYHSSSTHSNEYSSERKDDININSGHHRVLKYSNEDSSEHKDAINTKSGHHSSSKYNNEDSSEHKDERNTKSGHHSSSTQSNENSSEHKDERNTKSGHHSTSTQSNEDSSEITHSQHGSYEEHRSDVGKTKDKDNKKINDKYKTMKDSYQYSISKDFEFEGSSEPKALRQSLIIKTGGFPYKNLPNYIKQDLLQKITPQTDLQQLHNPFGIGARPSIDSINNALEQILTVKSGSLPQPGAWCCPNSMALKGFTCHNGDNKVPAEYFSHLTYFKFKDLMCQTGRPPAEVLGLMSGPELMNGRSSASIQGVVSGSPLAAASGSVPGVAFGDNPFAKQLLIQGGNIGQTNQGLGMDIQSWPVQNYLNSGILATGQLVGSNGLLPGSGSQFAGAESRSGSGLTFGPKDSLTKSFAPDLEIQKEIFEDEVIPWPGDSANSFDKIIEMMEFRNEVPITGNYENQYENNPLMMLPSLPNNFTPISQAGAIPSMNNFLSSNSKSEGMKAGDKEISSSSKDTITKLFNDLISQGLLPPAYGNDISGVKSSMSNPEISSSLKNSKSTDFQFLPNFEETVDTSMSGFSSPIAENSISRMRASSLVNKLPQEFESSSINQPSNMIPDEVLSWNWPLTENNFAGRLSPKVGEKEYLIRQQTNEIEEELLNWGFPKSNSGFVGRLPPKDGKEVSLIHQQSNPTKEELLSWGVPTSGNQFAGRLPPRDGKEEYLIHQQSNPIQEELSSWVFPKSDNHFAGRLPFKDGKEESLIYQQSNPKHEELLSWSFPESDNHFAGRLSPKDGKDEWVEDTFGSQNLLDNENKDWIDEGFEPKDYAWVPNDYHLVYDNLNQKPFDYTLQDKILLKVPEGLHLDMLSDPIIGDDYLLQDPNKNFLTTNFDFQNAAGKQQFGQNSVLKPQFINDKTFDPLEETWISDSYSKYREGKSLDF